MIVYNNNSTSKVFYSGFTITKIYACGGELVWSESPFTFKAQYTLNDATSGEVVCNGSSTLTAYEFDDAHNIRNMIVGECVDTWQVPVVNLYNSLRTLDLSHSNITTLPEKFMKGVTTLREVSLNPSATTISKDAFNGCTSLSAITIPSSVTNIGMSAFESSGLKNLTIKSGVTYSTHVYKDCNSLSSVTIEQGTRMIEEGTFSFCTRLTSVEFPSSITYLGVHAFISCSGMEYMVFHSTTPPNLGTDALANTNNCVFYVPCSAMAAYLAHEDWQPFTDRLRPIEPDCSYIQYRWTPSGTTCLGVDKYENSIKQVTYNSGTTWQNVSPAEYSATTLIEANSYDCGYRTRTTSSATYCDGDDLYVDVYSQVSEDGGTTWTTTATTKTLVEASGCAIEPQYRTLTTATTCVNVDKYVLAEYQVSYDEGETWTTTGTSATTLIESNSYDCGYRSRTVSTGVTCVGVDKHYLDEFQVSEDSGTTWTTVSSTTGSLIEAYSYDCGYRTRETSGSAYCNGTTKYIDVYSEYSEDGGQTWQTASTTPTLIEEHSFDCGYRTRTVSTGTTCVGNDKHSLEEYQVSTDSGSTWTTTGTSATTLIEANSYDCGYRTRTTSSATYCDGDDLYVDVYDQVSTDSGSTWTTTATTKTLVEAGACATVAEINYIASRKLDVNKTTFTPAATAETYDSTTSAGTIEFSEHVTAIGNFAFGDETNLISLTIPNSVTSIGAVAFNNCSNLTGITIPNGVTSIGQNAFMGCSSLSNAIVPNSVTSIGQSAFNGCSNLQSITIPDGVTNIGDYTFNGCSSLQSIAIPDGVTNIGQSAFNGCSNLQSITIPDGVTNIGDYTLMNCSSLQSIYCLPTTPPAIGSGVFAMTNNAPILVPCDSLSLYESAWSDYASRLQVIPNSCSQAFKYKLTLNDTSIVSANCDSTSSITQSEISAYTATCSSVEIGNCVTSIDYAGFYGYAATSITIGNNVTTIGSMAFGNCFYIASLVLPDSVTSIGSGAFNQCLNLTSCTLSNNLTSIDRSAFQSCYKLVEISIPSSVTNIGDYAFNSCSGLTSVTVNATTPPALGDYAFNSTNNCPIYVPAESLETYKSASGWSTYAGRIQALPNS